MGRTGLGVRVTASYRKKTSCFHGSGKGAYDLAWGGEGSGEVWPPALLKFRILVSHILTTRTCILQWR